MKKSPHEHREEKFKLYSAEWLDTDMKIQDLELREVDVPDGLYEKRRVMWDNIHFLLDEEIKHEAA